MGCHETLDLVTLRMIAERLDVAYKTARVWSSEGRLPEPAWRLDGKPVWLWSEVEDFIHSKGFVDPRSAFDRHRKGHQSS